MIAIIKGAVSLITATLVQSGAIPGKPEPTGADRVEITVLSEGTHSFAGGADFVVCRTQKEFDQAILRFGITQKKSMTADFGNGVVCLGFLGRRPTGGYGIKARSAYYLLRGGAGSDPAGQSIVPLLKEDGLNPESVPVAQLQGGDALVILKETCPPKDAMLAQVITSPFIIIYLRVPKPENVYVSFINCGGGK